MDKEPTPPVERADPDDLLLPTSHPQSVRVRGDVEPTIVWYGVGGFSNSLGDNFTIVRAWSDGTVEVKYVAEASSCVNPLPCSGWTVISSPTEGLNAAADINFDEVVNGQDLAVLLARWGDAPRNPMPPSDCPLGLLN